MKNQRKGMSKMVMLSTNKSQAKELSILTADMA